MGTYIVGAIVLAGIALAIRSVYKSKKKGDICGCGCAGCDQSKAGNCH